MSPMEMGMTEERKVRTLKGSEPANGGASGSEAGLTAGFMATTTTSATEKRPASGPLSLVWISIQKWATVAGDG